MNREDIIRMAREAGWDAHHAEFDTRIERFAALVASHALVEPCCGNYDQCQKVCMPRAASAEREACAKVCDEFNFGQAPMMIQKAIRARSGDQK